MGADAQSLAAFIARTGHAEQLRVEESFGDGFVRLRVDEAERRQAKHDIRSVEDAAIELLRNARDAGAHTIFLATSKSDQVRSLVVVDDGAGIPAEMQERIFDARVTSKLDSMHMDAWGVHGRGMALYSIRQNALKAEVAASAPGKGSSLAVAFDTKRISEKADQSSWPQTGTDEDGRLAILRGPHNILRTACEFVLEGEGRCEVYVGSPAECIAAARRRVRIPKDIRESLFTTALSELPLLLQLRLAADAEELVDAASHMGLEISSRTAHRILAGEIKPSQGAWQHIQGIKTKAPSKRRDVDLAKAGRTVSLSKEDLERFRGMLARDFQYLEDRYYLQLAAPPEVRVSSGKMQVSFDFLLDD